VTTRTRLIALSLLGLILLSGASGPSSSGLDIYFIDVMGGAATLLVSPARESVLIDSGWPGFDDRDPIRIVSVLKDVAGLDHLDHLVTTHWHRDHFGGVEGISKRVRIGHFWDRGLPDPAAPSARSAEFPDGPAPEDPLGIAYRRANEGRRSALRAGDTIPLKGGLEALVLASGGKVIAPDRRYPGKAVPSNPRCATAPADLAPDPSDNARSLALLFQFQGFDFLDCGDLTWNVEKQLVCPSDLVGRIDVFQVTHHGMDISNHPTLVQTIAPTVAIMDNGPRKGGAPKTVALLKQTPSIKAAYQLHRNAATKPEENTDPALIANTDPAGGQFIQVNVSADGKSYQVRIGKDGPAQRFSTK
jgi:beta-lactamase superfamily II metal-dependent hydrolase